MISPRNSDEGFGGRALSSPAYDLVVIGGGPAGYAGAIRAAQLGLQVALIEKEKLGGTCLHRGCIPSKAYLAAAEMVEMAKKAEKIGIRFDPPKIDFSKLVSRKDEKVEKLAKGIGELVKGNKITLISGEAFLEDSTHVRVGSDVHETRFILLATGSEPVRPSAFPFDGKNILTTDELFKFKDLPKSLLIVGGGVIGCEMACAFNLLGVAVTLVELQENILIHEERLAVKGLRSVLEKRGVVIKTGVGVQKMALAENQVQVSLVNGESLSVEKVLVAIGRKPSLKNLGLEKCGVAIENGFIQVDEHLTTNIENIYAAGDLVGTTLLAHGATAEALCAVEHIAGEGHAMNYGAVPRVIYTIPEIASVGAYEAELKTRNIPYRAGRFSYLACGKALCHEEDEGFAQILVGTDGELKEKILGATVFGAHASDLIQEVALVMQNKLSIKALIETVHAHPTLIEIIHEAAEDTQGMAIHKIGRRS